LEDVCGKYAPSIRLTDVESSEAILLLEGDLAKSHPRVASLVMRAVENGARLTTIGCVKTQMSRMASLHLPAIPGNEGEVLRGLLAAVLSLGLEDRASTALPCESLDALRRDIGSSSITEETRQAAEWFARTERAVILIAPTGGPEDQARKDVAGFATLIAITGHLGKSGSGLLPLLARSNVRGACDMGVAPDRLPGYEPIANVSARQRLRTLWGKDFPTAPGMDAAGQINAASGLICVADDPPSVLPAGQRAMAPLSNIEFLVVLDSFLTPTARLAHVLLPIASFAETEGTFTNLEGRVQKLGAVCDPPGEARSGWQVLAELCRSFGIATSYDSAAEILRESEKATNGSCSPSRRGEGRQGEASTDAPLGPKFPLHGTTAATLTSPARPFVLACEGSYDWGRDPLVSFSPTLNREHLSLHKLFPKGFVEICKQDADRLGIHAGRQVKLCSDRGEERVPVRLRPDLQPGVFLVPFAFRDHLANVLGEDGITAVNLEQV